MVDLEQTSVETGDAGLRQEKQVLFSCQGVRKVFHVKERQVEVLRDIALAVDYGEAVAISGRSGAGKSTLLGVLAGLDRPQAGTIRFRDYIYERLSNAELAALRRDHIGIIFQSFNLLPSWTAFENVEAALLHRGMTPEARTEQVIAMLESLGLGHHLHHLPAELSVGQQQRVAVARTLINNPALILADEPSGDVDPETAGEIIELLMTPVRKGHAAMIVTTHGTFPVELADRQYRMADGVLVEDEG